MDSVRILLGDKNCWGKGYATETIEVLTEHAFGVLGLHKLTAGAYAENVGSIRAFEKAGFLAVAKLVVWPACARGRQPAQAPVDQEVNTSYCGKCTRSCSTAKPGS